MSGPITWRNINQSSNADATRLMGLATDSVNQGIGEFQQIMTDARTRQDRNRATLKQNTDNRLLDYLQTFQTPEALEQSIQAGEVAAFTQQLGGLVDPALARTAATERLGALRNQVITKQQYADTQKAVTLDPLQDAAQLAIVNGDSAAVTNTLAAVAAQDPGAAATLTEQWQDAQRTKQTQERADVEWNWTEAERKRLEADRVRNEQADNLVMRLMREADNVNEAYTASLDIAANQLQGVVRKPDGSIDMKNTPEGPRNALQILMEQSGLRPTNDGETKARIQQGLADLGVPATQWAEYLGTMDRVQQSSLGLTPREQAELQTRVAQIQKNYGLENNGYALEPDGDPMSKALSALQQAQETNPKLTEALGDWSNQSRITGEVAEVMQNGLMLSDNTSVPVTSAQVRMALQMIQPTNWARPLDGFRTDFKKFLREIVSTDAAEQEREAYRRGQAEIDDLYTQFGASALSSSLGNK